LHRLRDFVGFAVMLQTLRAKLGRGRGASTGAGRADAASETAATPLPPSVLRNLPQVKPRNEFGLRQPRL
jgi:hypothetical protein